jgi:hypothetical protein
MRYRSCVGCLFGHQASPREKSWATMSAKLIRRSMNCRSEGIDADTRPRPQVSGALVERDGPIIHIIQARQPIPSIVGDKIFFLRFQSQ